MSDAPVAIAISEESGRRVELHDDRVARAFRAFDGYTVREIVADGGANTYLVDDEQWFIIGLVENALSRREEGRWEACRRLVQQMLVRLDRGTRAHKLIRDGCCSSHPSASQWRDALERALRALEVDG